MSDQGSRLKERLKSTGELLLGGARKQIEEYKDKFENLKGIYDKFLSELFVHYSGATTDTIFIDSFFGKRNLSFAGIDGSVHKQEVFDLLIFFAGAYSSYGTVHVKDSGEIEVEYEEEYLEKGFGVSSILPVYINEIPRIDQTLLQRDSQGVIDDSITFGDSWIVDNSAFADYLMGLAEFYIAYKLVSKENPIDVLIMDRILSAEIASFYAETSEFRISLDKECGLIGSEVDGKEFSYTEWVYARTLVGNSGLGTPPPRGEYLLHRVICELLNNPKGMTRDEIETKLKLDTDTRKTRLDKELEQGMKRKGFVEGIITRKGKVYQIHPRYKDIRSRVKQLLEETCERIFSEDSSVTYEDRFKIDGRWLTTNDLSFLSLMSIFFTMEACWENNSLLLGVAKDTSARDLKRQFIPALKDLGGISQTFDDKSKDTPDTDRMILQWVSLHERERLEVPWAIREYDTAFKTVVPHFEGIKGLVSGARRNQISLNKTFVKSYFQLCQAVSDVKLRSNVLLYDRLVYPEIDSEADNILILKHDYLSRPEDPEPIEVVVADASNNPMQTFVMSLFSRMTSMSIPELFGHLKPLYVADKVAKYYQEQFRGMVESAGTWLLQRPELREFLFYLSTFRERRSEHERTRRNT
ncbi:MAG: hypothetical protein GF411_13775 [Candidatus Lokiarchaeota archaeon]|nr:hypothetical protein [Candidatus Lokiarchaeota archaeon]